MQTFDREELARHNVFHQSIGIVQMTMVLLSDNEKSGRTNFTEEVGVMLFRNMIHAVIRKGKAIDLNLEEAQEVFYDAVKAVLSSANEPHAAFMEKAVQHYAEVHNEQYKGSVSEDDIIDDGMTFTV